MKFNNFTLIQDMVKCLSGIEISASAGLEQTIRSIHKRMPVDLPLPMLDDELSFELRKLRPQCIYEITGMLQLRFIILYDKADDSYLVVGPCLIEKPSKSDVVAHMRHIAAGSASVDGVLKYLDGLPMISYEVFHQLGDILAGALFDEDSQVPHKRIRYHWDFPKSQTVFFTDHYTELAQIRMVENRYEISAALTEAVKCGNLSLAYQFFRSITSAHGLPDRNPDPIRNSKNMCIVFNTQLRHALEDVGIHPFLLDQLSTDLAAKIEKLRSLEDGARFVADMIRQYCELVQKHAFPNLNPTVHLAATYVKNHLNENLTVKQIAQGLLVNPDYLSHKFKKEMGISLIDFINQERTKQAAALLTNSALQIQQIASLVGYNNASYFSKQFFRFFQRTPKDYRDQVFDPLS